MKDTRTARGLAEEKRREFEAKGWALAEERNRRR
jgi:hypothetical protein